MPSEKNAVLFPEFDESGQFAGDIFVDPTMKEDYQQALNEHLNGYVTGHLQYGGYHASPSHCRRYIREIWEAGEFALEKHVQAGTIGELPDESYECFTVRNRLGMEKRYGFSYFSQLSEQLRSGAGIPLLDMYYTPIERAYRFARENLLKFRKLVIEIIAVIVLLLSMMLYGAFFLPWLPESEVAVSGLTNARLFLYLLLVFLLVPILIFFQDAHKKDTGAFGVFYHPAVLTVMTLLCILSAVFGLRVFGVIKTWLIALVFWIPLAFYFIYLILDAVQLFSESRKIKYQKLWKKEYADAFEQNYERPLRYIRFRLLWWRQTHRFPPSPLSLILLQQRFRKYAVFYRWCRRAQQKLTDAESSSWQEPEE
ncbi:MAG: hypothetical protein IKH56_04410 [Oscillospiraceae bacterium]|nr:hypothetical protein [Oscillospiraceae bacterium]